VSSDPIVFIGPGSEWFWSMAQFVVVAITLIGIYYQFRLQRSANAFEQANRLADEWGSESILRAKVTTCRALLAGEDPPLSAVGTVTAFWEKVGGLVRRGHVDAGVVYDSLGNAARTWWALLEDWTKRARTSTESSDFLIHFEWLAGAFARIAEREGTVLPLDRTFIFRNLPEGIEAAEDQIRNYERMRGPAASRRHA
jgi:hypothetical protein